MLMTKVQRHARGVRQSHRRVARSPKRRLGASESRSRVPRENSKGGSYEISSYDCDFCGVHKHGDSNVACGGLLQGQSKMLPERML